MSMNKYDPRVKLLLVACFSSLIILFSNIYSMIAVFTLLTLFAIYFKADVIGVLKRLKKFIYMFVVLVFIQSLFNQQGASLITIRDFKLLTDTGLIMGASYLLRLFAVLLSGAIILTSQQKEIIQGLIQLRMPYDLAFMSSIGIRFLPMLVEQMQDTFIAIQLRGIDIKKLKLKNKLKIYSYIFTPVIVSTLKRAKNLSMSIEMRAFRVYDERTSITELKMTKKDSFLMGIVLLMTAIVIVLNII